MKTFVIGAALAASLRMEGVASVHTDPQHIERDEPKIDRVFVAPAGKPRPAFRVKRIATPTGFFWVVRGDPNRRQFRLKSDADAHLVTVEEAR